MDFSDLQLCDISSVRAEYGMDFDVRTDFESYDVDINFGGLVLRDGKRKSRFRFMCFRI